jgi:hypothetical protein
MSGLAPPDPLSRYPWQRYSPIMARVLIIFGIILILLGLAWGPIQRLGLGRLPGDIVIERENLRLYIPITSAILVSVVVSAAIALVRSFIGR